MHVKEIPQLIFSDIIDEPIVKNQREYAIELGYRNASDYPDRLVVVGQMNERVSLRQEITEPETYLSIHTNLRGALLAESKFDSAFCLVAGSRRTGSWTIGRGDHIKSNVWMWVGNNEYSDQEGLLRFKAVADAAGFIAVKASELLQTGRFDITEYGALDLEL